MFIKALTKSGSESLSGTSSNAFIYTDEIQLTDKIYDEKILALKIDIGGSTVAASTQLTIFPAISALSGGTFATITTASGTSLVLVGGTSASSGVSGSYFVPLTIVKGPGVTEPLRSVPYIKFGYRGFQGLTTTSGIPWRGTLCIG